jgi:hypothetical protein
MDQRRQKFRNRQLESKMMFDLNIVHSDSFPKLLLQYKPTGY